jgi:hypothetical protein
MKRVASPFSIQQRFRDVGLRRKARGASTPGDVRAIELRPIRGLAMVQRSGLWDALVRSSEWFSLATSSNGAQ